MRTALTVFLVLFVSALAADDAHARCMAVGLVFDRVGEVEVPAASPSFLLGLRPGAPQAGVERAPRSPRLVARGASHELSVETLAPGLVRLRAASAIAEGRYAVQGVSVDIHVVAGARATPPPLAAPDVSRIVTTRVARRGATTRAELAAPIPAGVAAVIVTRDGVPIAWRPVAASEIGTTAVLVAQTRRCLDRPEGYEPPVAGASVTLRFVDELGALSAESRAVVVVEGEP